MPTFDFSISKKDSKKRKTSQSSDRYKIVLKDTKGVIWVDKNGTYSVSLNDGFIYPIHKDCYSCKGKQKVYRHGQYDKNRCVYIRCTGEYNDCNNNLWLPFGVGCVVTGNLLIDNVTKLHVFYIKDCRIDIGNNESHDALEFYKKHLNEINDAIRNKR